MGETKIITREKKKKKEVLYRVPLASIKPITPRHRRDLLNKR